MTNITFNLDNNLIKFIKSYSIENNISQKQIIEQAIKKIQIEKIRKDIKKESIELWNQNKEELLFLANSGLDDYSIGLKKLENGK